MIEKIKKILKEKFDYELGDHAVYEISRGKNNLLLVTSILFVISFVFFVLDATEVLVNFMNLGILFFLLVVLVLVPLALQKGSKYEAVIVTEKYLIQRTGKSEFSVVEFDSVIKFLLSNDGILIKDDKASILLGLDLFREEIEPIIDILEAKGKTFDPEKDYMIRPIEIKFEDNKIILVDVEREAKTEVIYQEYATKYEMLTPGFINEILFRNSMIDNAIAKDDNLILALNSFDVKGGHPENTTFDTITAKDCILIFENVDLKQLLLQDLNKKAEVDIELPLELTAMKKYMKHAVISHWKSSGKDIDMYFATGVNLLKASFSFREVIIGWNESK